MDFGHNYTCMYSISLLMIFFFEWKMLPVFSVCIDPVYYLIFPVFISEFKRMIWVKRFKFLSYGFIFRFTLEIDRVKQAFYWFHGKVCKYIKYGQFTVWIGDWRMWLPCVVCVISYTYFVADLWLNCFRRRLFFPYIQDEMNLKWHIA